MIIKSTSNNFSPVGTKLFYRRRHKGTVPTLVARHSLWHLWKNYQAYGKWQDAYCDLKCWYIGIITVNLQQDTQGNPIVVWVPRDFNPYAGKKSDPINTNSSFSIAKKDLTGALWSELIKDGYGPYKT